MYIALYRKYRPQNFSEVINQEHVKRTLTNALKLGKVSHAYLFSGQRGVGKTTVARILAKALNCEVRSKKYEEMKDSLDLQTSDLRLQTSLYEPCNKCQACQEIIQNRSLDLVEIDAASTRGIDEIRELREKIKFSPTRLKYKVFIIDEVHMLTLEAFNALLKTLEEPPEHAIFILCTTTPHKIPATILSRCQRFDFKKIGQKEIIEHLESIAKKEKVKIEKEALELITAQSAGSCRDALSLLAQVIAYEDKHITLEEVKSILGIPDFKVVAELIELLVQGKRAQAIKLVNQIAQSGYDLQQFAKNIIEYLRQILLLRVEKQLTSCLDKEQFKIAFEQAKLLEDKQIISWIGLFNEARRQVASSVLPQLPLELVCLEATQKTNPCLKQNQSQKDTKKQNNSLSPLSIQDIRDRWPELLAKVRSQNHGLFMLLDSVEPHQVKDNCLILACLHNFHKQKIQEYKNITLLEKNFEQIFGSRLVIKCQVMKSDKKQNSELIDTVLKIFKGKIVE